MLTMFKVFIGIVVFGMLMCILAIISVLIFMFIYGYCEEKLSKNNDCEFEMKKTVGEDDLWYKVFQKELDSRCEE